MLYLKLEFSTASWNVTGLKSKVKLCDIAQSHCNNIIVRTYYENNNEKYVNYLRLQFTLYDSRHARVVMICIVVSRAITDESRSPRRKCLEIPNKIHYMKGEYNMRHLYKAPYNIINLVPLSAVDQTFYSTGNCSLDGWLVWAECEEKLFKINYTHYKCRSKVRSIAHVMTLFYLSSVMLQFQM